MTMSFVRNDVTTEGPSSVQAVFYATPVSVENVLEVTEFASSRGATVAAVEDQLVVAGHVRVLPGNWLVDLGGGDFVTLASSAFWAIFSAEPAPLDTTVRDEPPTMTAVDDVAAGDTSMAEDTFGVAADEPVTEDTDEVDDDEDGVGPV